MWQMGDGKKCLIHMCIRESKGKQYRGISKGHVIVQNSAKIRLVNTCDQALGATNGAARISALTFSYQRIRSRYEMTSNKVVFSF